ncbi:MAG: FHIPEP family type III secretion protein [Planctomycetes bacterium]|nr:FHIPEP family type III secretion protein [Planctomycetota bacterium]
MSARETPGARAAPARAALDGLEPRGGAARRGGSEAILALGILAALLVILVPLPPGLLDVLLVANLAASFVILMATACAARPLELSVFPTVLLAATFARLALNVATTRLILGGAAERGLGAAGRVVEAFAEFVAGSSLATGFVVFAIIVVVQFVVITKGTTRISEVAARFALDAMPGKQLSIDGDLASGAIDEEEAQRRRGAVGDEASFFGAMDGAAKFVRGEAVAGIFILLVNVLGGFFVGTFQHGMEAGQAADLFTRLTVGDGLVTQVPALMVSIATALLVTKSSVGGDSTGLLSRQLLASHRVFFAAALFLLALVPAGLPPLPLVLGALACAVAGLLARRSARRAEPAAEGPEEPAPGQGSEEKARSLLVLEPLELEIGFRLIGLVDEARGGDLMARLAKVREKVALDLGLVVPPVKVQDNTRLHPAEYSIKLRGNGVGRWRVRPDRYLVTFEGEPPARLEGTPGADPATGKAGLWVDEGQCPEAASAGCRLRKVSEVITDHLDSVIRVHAAEVLTREEASRLVADLRRRAPALVDELIPGTLKLGEVHKVLQGLLREQVSIRDLEAVLEALADAGDRTRDTAELTEHARRALSRSLCASVAGRDGTIHALLLDPALEEFLQRSVEKTDRGTRLAIEPETAEALAETVAAALPRLGGSRTPVLACSGMIRAHMRALTAGRAPLLRTLAYEEVTEDFRLEERGTVALEKEAMSRS